MRFSRFPPFSLHCKCQNHIIKTAFFANLEQRKIFDQEEVSKKCILGAKIQILLLLFRFLVIFLDFESLSYSSSIVELEIVYIKQKLWFRSWWIEQEAYWEKLGPTNQSIMMKCMHNMLLLLFPMLWTTVDHNKSEQIHLKFRYFFI